jgi:hypothetical protein
LINDAGRRIAHLAAMMSQGPIPTPLTDDRFKQLRRDSRASDAPPVKPARR